MDLFVALLFLIIGTANGWALHEKWLKRKKNQETPYRVHMRCNYHNIKVDYKVSDETILINFMRKWDDVHGDCPQEVE